MKPDKSNFLEWLDRRRPLKSLQVAVDLSADAVRFELVVFPGYLICWRLWMTLTQLRYAYNWRTRLAHFIWVHRSKIRKESPRWLR